MGKLEKQETELSCPKCGRAIEISFYDMMSRREAKCSRCYSKYKFDSSAISTLRSRISDLERAQEKFEDAVRKIVTGADIEIKN